MIVENRAGAAGTLGHAAVAQSAPDGYTLLLGTNSTYAIAPHLFEQLPYDGDKAFTPISLVARSPQVWCAHPSMPLKDFKGFLDYARARQPDGVTFEIGGPRQLQPSGHRADDVDGEFPHAARAVSRRRAGAAGAASPARSMSASSTR